MYEKELKKLVEENSVYKLKGASDIKIKEIEEKLNVSLPDSYKWILTEYGSVSFEGIEIDGIGLNNTLISVDNTIGWKEYGIPEGYVVIFEPGADWIYCLDTFKMYNCECPVVAWYPGTKYSDKEADNLYKFIIDRLDL
ncbi:SMI1/KNR4 family protein [Chengkuizengella sediminis]|uniref:SMI1/KNR4 family protein n=1 Tax=Chengkuizengella sediminis TaxID=1885917 RepID=UPI00138A0996|nr:SMI1/KNR4 family protein [Chengkuizengella sediminis]NDI35763.1 SMI1/KNR4 family protein [Chengkuizengella sediminis]